MKNKNRIYRAAALLLVLCFISTVMISGTFAKYTSEYVGQDTALVAKWSFGAKVGQSDSLEAMGSGTVLNLFQHAYEAYINQKVTGDDNDTYIIAPGVEGEFVVAMDYLADVDADVTISINPLSGNAAVPVEYLVDGGSKWVELDGLAGALAQRIKDNTTQYGSAITGLSGNIFRIAATTSKVEISETVKWRWAYDTAAQTGNPAIESSDTTDTKLGEDSAAGDSRTSYGIKITLTATQVLPTTGDETAIATTSITGIGNISGTAKVGEILTAGAITPFGAAVSYQWQISSDGVDYTDISTATEKTYSPLAGDVNKKIRVVATGITGYAGTVYSALVGPIAAAD